MAEVAIKLNLKVEDLIEVVKQLPFEEQRRLKDWLDREVLSGPSEIRDAETILLAESPTFRTIVETVERDIKEGRTSPLEEIWDEL